MSGNTVDSTTDEIDSEDIERMSEEIGVGEDIIESSIESKKANEIYFNNNPNIDNKKENNNRILTAFSFLRHALVRSPTVPEYGVVEDVGTYRSKVIKLTVSSEYPGLPSEDVTEDRITKEFKFRQDVLSEQEDLEYIMNKAGVNKPSDLVGKEIPIFPNSKDLPYNRDEIAPYEFTLPNKPRTVEDKISYYNGRLFVKTKSGERYSDHLTSNDVGEWDANRNIVLLPFLLTTSLSVLFYLLGLKLPFETISIFAACFGAIYGLIVFSSLYFAATEVLTKPQGDRSYIRDFMNK